MVVSGGAVVSFGWYAAIKGAYLSTTFSSLVVERNLVYLSPLAFVATAYLLERAAAPVWAVVVAGAAVLGLIVWVPIDRGLDNFPYYEAHGLAILALANREWAWPLGRIETAVELLTLASVVLLLLLGTPLRARLATVAAPVAVAVAVALVGWNLTAEVYASIGEHDFSALVERNIPKPNDWVDRAAGGGTVVMLGQRMSDDPLGVPSTEFWNRSIVKVWSVDGTGPGPGHTLTPDLQDIDGTLWPDPETDFVLTSGGVEVVGEQVATNAGSALVRLDGPIRLRSNQTGIAADGWILGDPGDATVPARAALQPLRRLRRRDGQGGRDALPRDVLPRGRAAAGDRPRADRRARDAAPTSSRRSRARPPPRRSTSRPAARERSSSPRPTARGASRSRSRPSCRRRSIRRAPAASAARSGRGCRSTSCRASRGTAATTYVNRARSASRASGPVRSAAFSRPTAGPGSRRVCGTKNGRSSTRAKPASWSSATTSSTAVLARVEVEHELPLREPRHPREERATVARVVDRAEDRRRRDRAGGLVEVQVADCAIAAASPSRRRAASTIAGSASTPA